MPKEKIQPENSEKQARLGRSQAMNMARLALRRANEIALTAEEKQKIIDMISRARELENAKDLAGAIEEYNNVRRFIQEIKGQEEIVEFEGKKMRKDQVEVIKQLASKLWLGWMNYVGANSITSEMNRWKQKQTETLATAVAAAKIDDDGYIFEIYVDNSHLQELPPLPQKLHALFCANNNLYRLPALPDSLKLLDCSGNPLTVEGVKTMEAHKNFGNFNI